MNQNNEKEKIDRKDFYWGLFVGLSIGLSVALMWVEITIMLMK